ncbi:hypothetical protein MT962_000622 [Franconibacter sp. IITDAS19]|uniref:sigma factor-like helix-turn-helix DNA-binding protein n=1 Tax=Franconibacter sp. IITDAS19 TaxID=2930569 RepID=UPI001FF9E28E|nr:sigma factor-like helix-turn-helix DNA-binding protein [Franconibacter sp. IITDAS19]MCK1966836.1 hypothetical protein [Franconibacter sp. IITDAS19]
MPLIKLERKYYPQVCEAYKAGNTHIEVAEMFGISRERVRQILEENGLNRKDGGVKKKAAKREEQRRKDFFKKYGCTREQFNSVCGHYSEKSKSPYYAFLMQKRNAKERNVEWRLLFWDWWNIWTESGKWLSRGRDSGCFCMCRVGDSGAYETGNVYISTVNHNTSLGKTLAAERKVKRTFVYSLIKRAGGPLKVSQKIGINPAYISQLANRNIIPTRWFSDGKVSLISSLTGGKITPEEIQKRTGATKNA